MSRAPRTRAQLASAIEQTLLTNFEPNFSDEEWQEITKALRCPSSETKAADRDAIIEECARAVIGSRVLWDDELPTVGDRVHDALEQVAEQVRRLKSSPSSAEQASSTKWDFLAEKLAEVAGRMSGEPYEIAMQAVQYLRECGGEHRHAKAPASPVARTEPDDMLLVPLKLPREVAAKMAEKQGFWAEPSEDKREYQGGPIEEPGMSEEDAKHICEQGIEAWQEDWDHILLLLQEGREPSSSIEATVPAEATPEMVEAARNTPSVNGVQRFSDVWRAMLAAAPQTSTPSRDAALAWCDGLLQNLDLEAGERSRMEGIKAFIVASAIKAMPDDEEIDAMFNDPNTRHVPAPLSDCLRILRARHNGSKGGTLSPAEMRELEEAASLLELAYPALRELCLRIEKCGASIELTNAVTLCSDLMSAIGNQWNPRDKNRERMVRTALGESA